MSEVPLQGTGPRWAQSRVKSLRVSYTRLSPDGALRGPTPLRASLELATTGVPRSLKTAPLPRIISGPETEACCSVLGGWHFPVSEVTLEGAVRTQSAAVSTFDR